MSPKNTITKAKGTCKSEKAYALGRVHVPPPVPTIKKGGEHRVDGSNQQKKLRKALTNKTLKLSPFNFVLKSPNIFLDFAVRTTRDIISSHIII